MAGTTRLLSLLVDGQTAIQTGRSFAPPVELILGVVFILAGVLLSVAAYFYVGQVGFRSLPASRARIQRRLWFVGPAASMVGVVMLKNYLGE